MNQQPSYSEYSVHQHPQEMHVPSNASIDYIQLPEQSKEIAITELVVSIASLALVFARVKLMRSMTGLKFASRETRDIITQQQKISRMRISDLQACYTQAQQRLGELERERKSLISDVKDARVYMCHEVLGAIENYYSDIIKNVEDWIGQYCIQQPMGLMEVFSRAAHERVVAEVAEYLSARTAMEFNEWQQTTLQPLINHNIDIIEQELGEKTQHFMAGLNEVYTEFVANTASSTLNSEQVAGQERALTIATGIELGLAFDNPELAIIGDRFDLEELLKDVLLQIAVMLATAIVLGPAAFVISAVLAASLSRGMFKASTINKKIRDAVGQEYKQKMQEVYIHLKSELANSIDKKFAQLQDELDQTMGVELQNVHDQVQSIVNERLQGEARVIVN